MYADGEGRKDGKDNIHIEVVSHALKLTLEVLQVLWSSPRGRNTERAMSIAQVRHRGGAKAKDRVVRRANQELHAGRCAPPYRVKGSNPTEDFFFYFFFWWVAGGGTTTGASPLYYILIKYTAYYSPFN